MIINIAKLPGDMDLYTVMISIPQLPARDQIHVTHFSSCIVSVSFLVSMFVCLKKVQIGPKRCIE